MSAQLPDTWGKVSVRVRTASTATPEGNAPRKRKKKQSVDTAGGGPTASSSVPDLAQQSTALCTTVDKQELLAASKSATAGAVQSSILQTISSWSTSSQDDRAGALDTILSNVSKNLQGIVSMTGFKKLLRDDTKNLFYVNDIRPISKKYEDSYLRQPMASGERPCIRGSQCECMLIDPTQPFVGVEFLLPWEKTNAERSGLCLPCLRAATQLLFFEILQSKERVEGVIQRFYNKHEEGEYALENMLVCPPNGPVHNLPMPVRFLFCVFLL
jgi:hypothetical protein